MFSVRKSLMPLTASAAVLALAGFVAPGPAAASGAGSTVWVAQPLCGTPAPGRMSCHAMELVAQHLPAGSVRPAAAVARPALSDGPSGGYTPTQLAKAYGLDVNAAASANQTVAIVDAYDDPTVLSDLNTFNAQYGLPAETATSFKVVNQTGGSTKPAADAGWAGEITLDVQTVRGLCHKCKIVLVEGNSNSFADLAASVNEAAALHANEVSNSYGGTEASGAITPTIASAYDHAGIAIVASTGDDGWYGWDRANVGSPSTNAANVPAAYPTVIGVGGTSLYLNPDGTRAGEQVWNNNGPNDVIGDSLNSARGAAGGGCSTVYAPKPFQSAVAGYSTLGCGSTKRSVTDIAAIADPFTGYDVYQTYGASPAGWKTFGGTSLAAPVVAAMWALAGGPGGVNYPALSLYGHFKSDATPHTYDVTIGGTGICSTAGATSCLQWFGANPNTFGFGWLDCAFGAGGSAIVTNRSQCYARPGYDGVAGVGTPKGSTVFTALSPTAVISSPGTVSHNVAKVFSAAGSTDPFPGGSITSYAWNWGDAHTSTGKTPSHMYTGAGARTITLKITDVYGRTRTTTRNITVT